MDDLADRRDGAWTLLTGHGHVLVEVARNPKARIRDISAVVGLTERTVQAIVADLEAAGYLSRTRTGRRTLYTVNSESLFRHEAQEGHRVGPFLALLAGDPALDSAADPGGSPTEAAPGEDRSEAEPHRPPGLPPSS
jgi:hypothetical protein